MKKRAPRKNREIETGDYWLTHDSAGEIDWAAPGVRLEFDADVERPTRSVTIRLPSELWRELRVIAKQRDVPYQSLMKMLLADKVAEIRRITSRNALPKHGD